MKSGWIVSSADATATITHAINYYTATHEWTGEAIRGHIHPGKSFSYTSDPLDLCLYGLDPIVDAADTPVAIIGFVPRQFLVLPVPTSDAGTAPTPFTITSTGNNLLIRDTTDYAGDKLAPVDAGAGFAASETSLTATFSEHCTSLTMSVYFKVIDTATVYKLFMKNWKALSTGVRLNIVINGDIDNEIVLYVDALEAEGGENNLSSLTLRDLSYGSVEGQGAESPRRCNRLGRSAEPRSSLLDQH